VSGSGLLAGGQPRDHPGQGRSELGHLLARLPQRFGRVRPAATAQPVQALHANLVRASFWTGRSAGRAAPLCGGARGIFGARFLPCRYAYRCARAAGARRCRAIREASLAAKLKPARDRKIAQGVAAMSVRNMLA
jgi:hypothetical protein